MKSETNRNELTLDELSEMLDEMISSDSTENDLFDAVAGEFADRILLGD